MLESLRRNFDIEDFPEMTIIIAAIILTVFLFSVNENVAPLSKKIQNNVCFITCPSTCSFELGFFKICAEPDYSSCSCVLPKLNLYENVFGFIPAKPQIYTLTTYLFIHENYIHVFSNLLFFLIAGIAIEETLGKWVFASVFFVSGYFAVIFDILGRFMSGLFSNMNHACAGPLLNCVNLGGPFIGASGAIFGLMAVSAIVKPMEKIPTILVVLAFIPLAQMYYDYQVHLDYFTKVFVSAFIIIIAMSIFFISPGTVPMIVAILAFIFSWLFIILLNISGNVSNVGHLGGVIGGIVSYFIFSKTKRT